MEEIEVEVTIPVIVSFERTPAEPDVGIRAGFSIERVVFSKNRRDAHPYVVDNRNWIAIEDAVRENL